MEEIFDREGNLLHYATFSGRWDKNNAPIFLLSLKLQEVRRGRSAAYFIFEDINTGLTYPMFLSSLEKMLNQTMINKGCVKGIFQVVKRGSNFGIEYQQEINEG